MTVDAASLDADPTAPAKVKTPLNSWWMLTVLLLFCVLSYLDRYILTMLVGPIKADLGMSDFQMSLVLGPAFAVCFAVAGLPFGWAVDRYPRRWVIFIGVATWAMATTAAGFARTFPALFMARVGVGVGEASLSPAAYSLLSDGFPRERLTTAIAIYQTGIKFGSAAAFGLGGLAIALAGTLCASVPLLEGVQPWQVVLVMAGSPGLIIACLAFTFSEPARRGKLATGASNWTALRGFLNENKLLLVLMLLGFSCVSIAHNAVIAWVPTFLERRFGWTPIQYGPVLSVIALGSAATTVLKGGVVDWLYGRGMKDVHIRFFSWLLLATAPIGFAMFFVPSAIVFMILDGFVAVVSLGYGLFMCSTIALIAPSELRGQLNALFLSFMGIAGIAMGPMIVGFITTFLLRDDQAVGVSLAMTVGGALAIALVFMRLALRPAGDAIWRVDRLDLEAQAAAR